jgi:hypothetical protein
MNRKKILIVPIFGQHWFHIGALGELILKNRDNFSEVKLLFMRDGFLLKPRQIHHHKIFRGLTSSPEQILHQFLLDKGIKCTFRYTFANAKVDLAKTSIENLNQLRTLESGNLKIGMAICSELITIAKSATPKIKKYSKRVNLALKTAVQITRILETETSKYKNDNFEIWICNGRPFHERIVVEFCKREKINHKFYEVILDEITGEMRPILHPKSPHSRIDFQNEILDFSNNNFNKKKAVDWFTDRSKQNMFTKNQRTNFHYDSDKKLFVFFTSSDDELIAVSEEWRSPWEDQITCAKKLLTFFKESELHDLIIRVHPNMSSKSRIDRNKWRDLKKIFPDQIILWNQDIDSYSLMNEAAAVLVHGSTIGIEAIFWGIPTGLLCNTRYDRLISGRNLFQIADIVDWIENNLDMPIEAKRNSDKSLVWGNYYNLAGERWNDIKFKDFTLNQATPILINKKLRPNYIVIFASRILNHLEYFIQVV